MKPREVLCDQCRKPMRISEESPPGGVLGSNTSFPTPTRTEPLSASLKLPGRKVVYYCDICFDTKIIEE
jgi:hypothetical protein